MFHLKWLAVLFLLTGGMVLLAGEPPAVLTTELQALWTALPQKSPDGTTHIQQIEQMQKRLKIWQKKYPQDQLWCRYYQKQLANVRAGIGMAASQISYEMEEGNLVSLGIFNANGQLVRSLLNAAARPAGEQEEEWDGRDNAGKLVPGGVYFWRLLAYPGLRIRDLLTLGTSIADPWPGGLAGIAAVTVDPSGLYIAAGASKGTPIIIKQTFSGKQLWSIPATEDGIITARGVTAMAATGRYLFVLGHDGRILRFNARDGGDHDARLDSRWKPGKRESMDAWQSRDMDADASQIVISYADQDLVRWFDPNTGKKIREKTITEPISVAIDGQGNTLILSRDTVFKLTPDAEDFLPLITKLQEPWRVTVDRGINMAPKGDPVGGGMMEEFEEGKVSLKLKPKSGRYVLLKMESDAEDEDQEACQLGEIWLYGVRAPLKNQTKKVTEQKQEKEINKETIQVRASGNGRLVLDGNPKTVWNEVGENPHWMRLDLGKRWEVRRLEFWQNGRITSFEVYVIDATDAGNILVAERGESQQVRRFSADGKFIAAYGQVGGRHDGPYQPESFRDVADLCSDNRGGFVACEASSPPGRVVCFNRAGKLTRQWLGPQPQWLRGIPDPENPESVWVDSWENSFLRFQVDYQKGTKELKRIDKYGFLASGLVGPGTPVQSWQLRRRNGNLYLVRESAPCVILVTDQGLRPLTASAPLLDAVLDDLDDDLQAFLETQDKKGSLIWTDANGDGDVQDEEIRLFPDEILWNRWSVGPDFSLLAMDGEKIVRLPVLRWNEVGAPVYDWSRAEKLASAPNGEKLNNPDLLSAAGVSMDAEGNTYALKLNRRNPAGYAYPARRVGEAAVIKWQKQGQLVWQIGVHATAKRNMAGEWQYPTRLLGEAYDCVLVADRLVQPGVAWTRDGLYVGRFLDHPEDAFSADRIYTWDRLPGGEPGLIARDCLAGGSVLPEKDGTLLWFAQGWNNVPIYRLSGWNKFSRRQGKITPPDLPVAAGPLQYNTDHAPTPKELKPLLKAMAHWLGRRYRNSASPVTRLYAKRSNGRCIAYLQVGTDFTDMPGPMKEDFIGATQDLWISACQRAGLVCNQKFAHVVLVDKNREIIGGINRETTPPQPLPMPTIKLDPVAKPTPEFLLPSLHALGKWIARQKKEKGFVTRLYAKRHGPITAAYIMISDDFLEQPQNEIKDFALNALLCWGDIVEKSKQTGDWNQCRLVLVNEADEIVGGYVPGPLIPTWLAPPPEPGDEP